MSLITKTGALLARTSLVLAIIGLLGVVVCVQAQVIGRYVFNDTPTWAEALAMLLILYVTALGVAVGVRDGGHIGFDSMVAQPVVAITTSITTPTHFTTACDMDVLPTRRAALAGLGASLAGSAERDAIPASRGRQPPNDGGIAPGIG